MWTASARTCSLARQELLLWVEEPLEEYYWLDMVKLFESFMRPNQELVAVKYFSARVEDDGKSLRQNAFFQANQLNPKFFA